MAFVVSANFPSRLAQVRGLKNLQPMPQNLIKFIERESRLSQAQVVHRLAIAHEEIETADMLDMVGDPNVVIADIRDVRERQCSGFVPESFHAPRGMLKFWVDPDSPYFKDIFTQDGKKFVFHCASGWRSAITVATLQDAGFTQSFSLLSFNTRANHAQ